MFPWAAQLAMIARRIGARRSMLMTLKLADACCAGRGGEAPGKYCARFCPISFGSGRMKVTSTMPVTISTGSISQGSASGSWPRPGAARSAAATSTGLIASPTIEPSAT